MLSYDDYCWERGAFRQKELIITAQYGSDYLQHYATIEDKTAEMSKRRVQVLEAFVPKCRLLDYGCGRGEFVAAAIAAGWDVGKFDIDLPMPTGQFEAVTFFDSLEHLIDPVQEIRNLDPKWMMLSLPECHYPECKSWFMNWKHRKPGEHLRHFSRSGLDYFMAELGYRPIMHSNFEDDIRLPYDCSISNILTAIYKKR